MNNFAEYPISLTTQGAADLGFRPCLILRIQFCTIVHVFSAIITYILITPYG